MPYALSEYEEGSWWVKELEGLLGAKTGSPVTPDQRRAAGVALDFARLVWADRRTLQAEGKHPAPCARECEANAFKIEIRQLKAQIKSQQENQKGQVAV